MRSLVLLEKIPADKAGTIDHTNAEALDPRHTGGSGDSEVVENFIFNSPAGSGATAPTTKKKALYALNVTGLAVRTFRQPLQVGIPKSSPILFDVGSYRPVITVTGLVPREAAPVGRTVPFDGQDYYSPTYFQLQHAVTQWNYLKGQEMTVTIIHTNVQSATYDKYNVAIQTCNFTMSSLDQRRWAFDLAFVCTRPVSVRPSSNV